MKKQLLFTGLLLMALAAQAQVDIATTRSQSLGSTVTVRGLVTTGTEFSPTHYIQDVTAGIAVYDPNLQVPVPGDSVQVTGELSEFNGLLEIINVSNYTVINSGNNLPQPKTITLSSGFVEANEGMLVKVNGVSFVQAGTFSTSSTNYDITDGSQQREVRVWSGTNIGGTAIPSGQLAVIGILGEYQGTYQFQPRSVSDFDLAGDPPVITSPLVQKNITSTGFTVEFTTQLDGNTIINYGLTPALGTFVADATMTMVHSTDLIGLTPAMIYYVQAMSVSAAGDTSFSAVRPIATASLSSGQINVYFNHPVDHSVAKGVNATYTTSFADIIKKYINQAQHTIDFAIYNFDNNNGIANALNAAAQRGVVVRVIADDGVNNSGYNSLDLTISKMQSPTGTSQSGQFYGIMHNKFLIVDAESSDPDDPWVLTGSTNMTDQQLKVDANNIIAVQDQSLARAYQLEFNEMWGGAFGPDKKDNTPHMFNVNGDMVELYFSPSDDVENKIKNTIYTADDEIYFSIFTWTRFNIAYDIEDKIQDEGVLAAGMIEDTANGSAIYNILIDNMDTTFLLDQQPYILHHKYLLVDPNFRFHDPLVLTGSHNWSNSANIRNDENTLIVHDDTVANLYFQEWMQRFKDNGGNLTVPEDTSTDTTGIFTVPGASMDVNLYPNPSGGEVWISLMNLTQSAMDLEVYDIAGNLIARRKFELPKGLNCIPLNMEALSGGVYLLNCNMDGRSITKKVVLTD